MSKMCTLYSGHSTLKDSKGVTCLLSTLNEESTTLHDSWSGVRWTLLELRLLLHTKPLTDWSGREEESGFTVRLTVFGVTLVGSPSTLQKRPIP